MKLKGEIVDKLRVVLGGKTPTARRIEKLLDELAKGKDNIGPGVPVDGIAGGAPPEVVSKDVMTLIQQKFEQAGRDLAQRQSPVDGMGESILPKLVAAPSANIDVDLFIPPGQEPEPDEPSDLPAAPSTEAPAPGVAEALVIATQNNAMLLETIKNMEARINELKNPQTEAAQLESAIGAGKMPVSSKSAPPVGYTGSAQLPRGQWFKSPFGPPVQMKVCDCKDCTPYRLQHYFCVMCRRGPLDYQQRHPKGRKMWFAPGSVWGISHECCSVTCWGRYQEQLGIVAGVNDLQPPAADEVNPGEPPPREALVPGSD